MNNHEEQKHLLNKSIEHLEIALSYLSMAESFCNKSVNALCAEYESIDVETLLEKARYTRDMVGATWEIEIGVLDNEQTT